LSALAIFFIDSFRFSEDEPHVVCISVNLPFWVKNGFELKEHKRKLPQQKATKLGDSVMTIEEMLNAAQSRETLPLGECPAN
jgi:hypothetical protein